MASGLFKALKRRRVFRSAAIYAAAAWGVTEASTTVFEYLNFPAWASTLVVIAFLVGFPVAIYLSWVFDITAEGIRRTEPLGMQGWGAITLSSIMLVGGTAALFWLLYDPARDSPSEPGAVEAPLREDTIAVLPFTSAGETVDVDYFAEGVAETLLAQLSGVANLRVIARDSAFSLRDSNLDARAKARRLNAAYLLDGSVQRGGDALRIIVRLVDGESGRYLWSETLDGSIDEVFDIQDRISESVVTQLEPIAAGINGKSVARRFTVNAEAYDYYLRGRFAISDLRPEALDRAVADFDRAIELDEDFALAYIGRANARAFAAGNSFFVGRVAETDPLWGDWHDYFYPVSVREAGAALETLIGPDIKRAIELAPELSEAHAASGLLLLRMGRFDEAEAALRRAIALNPNDAFSYEILGLLYLEINRYNLAIEHLETGLELDPLSWTMHFGLMAADIYTEDHERSIARFETLRAIWPERLTWLHVRYPLWHAGRYPDQVLVYLDLLAEIRAGRQPDPSLESAFVEGYLLNWGLVHPRVHLGDIDGAQGVIDSPKTRTVVNGRRVFSEEEKAALGPVNVWKIKEEWAGAVRFTWVIHDESFQDAYDNATEIIATAPEGLHVSPMTHSYAARYALALGDCAAAKQHFELASKDLARLDWPYSNVHLDFLSGHVDAIDYAIALRCMGEEEEAQELIDGTLEWLDEMEANGYGVSQIPVVRAKAHVLRGERDLAMDFLEQYAALPGPILIGIKNDPAFKSVEDDARFRTAVATIREKNRVAIEQIDRAVEEAGLEF